MAIECLLYPLRGEFPITQLYGENPQDYPTTNGHMGIDWGCPVGTPVLAAADGVVSRHGWDNTGYGIHVRIKHDGGAMTIYGHLSSVNSVSICDGAPVRAGDAIGLSGNTGNSTGPHLHFEYRPDGAKAADPLPLIKFAADTYPIIVDEPEFEAGDKVRVKLSATPFLNARSGPGKTHKDIGDMHPGAELNLERVEGRWGQVKVWICLDYVEYV